MLLCSLFWGSEPFCNFRLRSPKSFPFTLPRPLYFHHSCLLHSPHSLLLWPSLTSPINVLVAPCRVVMMMMSPYCLSLVLIVFLKSLYVVRLGLLYFCVKSWHYKKHVKRECSRGIGQDKDMIRRGLRLLEGCGTFAEGNQWICPFCHSCKCSNLVFWCWYFSVVLARTMKKETCWNELRLRLPHPFFTVPSHSQTHPEFWNLETKILNAHLWLNILEFTKI